MKKFALFCVGLVLVLSSSALAGTVEFEYGEIFGTGNYSDFANPAPWFSSTFEDINPGTVKLTIDAYNLYGNEAIDKLYYNVDYAGSLNFSRILGTAPLTSTNPIVTPVYTPDSYDVGAGVNDFDIYFDFLQNGGNRFTDGKYVEYYINGTGLTAQMFDTLNAGGDYKSAAHFLSDTSGKSAFVGNIVPEPLSAALFLIGGAGLALARRKKKA